MQMKKPAWASMQVIDVRELSKEKLTELGKAYDALAKKELSAIAAFDVESDGSETSCCTSIREWPTNIA